MPFLKGVVFSWVIFTTFNRSYVNVIGCPFDYIFSHIPLVIFFFFLQHTYFPSLNCDCAIPYMWLWSDVIGTPHLQPTICMLPFVSTLSIVDFKESSSNSQFGSNHAIKSHTCPLKPLFFNCFLKNIFRFFKIHFSKNIVIIIFLNIIMLR